MTSTVKLSDEYGRAAALHRYDVMDSGREEQFDRIIKLVQMVLDVPIASVSLVSEDRNWSKSCVGMPFGNDVPRELSFCTHAIQGAEPMAVADATLDERFVNNPAVLRDPHVRSYLGVPLTTPDGYNIGALCAVDTRTRHFSAEQVQMLSSFASLVIDELELRRIAQTDYLTGALSRRGFVLELEKQIARATRAYRPNALLMVDVDHFKTINDTHGHPAGDDVLKNLSDRLHALLRAGDVIGRLGGEEFGILLPETDLEAAYKTAERMRLAIAEGMLAPGSGIKATISLGISCPSAAPTNAALWLAEADRALYEAKSTGRNCCRLA